MIEFLFILRYTLPRCVVVGVDDDLVLKDKKMCVGGAWQCFGGAFELSAQY